MKHVWVKKGAPNNPKFHLARKPNPQKEETFLSENSLHGQARSKDVTQHQWVGGPWGYEGLKRVVGFTNRRVWGGGWTKALSIVEHDYFNWVTGPRRESLLVWMEIKIANNGGIVVICGISQEPQEVAARSLIVIKR